MQTSSDVARGEGRNAPRARRSALFVPGDKPRALEKAAGLGADVLILDLEDAVAPASKAAAREAAHEAVAAWRGDAKEAEHVLRINALGDEHFGADIALAAAACPDVVLLPKVDSPAALREARAALDGAGYHGLVWAMIESPTAVLNLRLIAEMTSAARLAGLVAGTNDLGAALRCRFSGERRDPLLPHLAQILLAARSAGLIALDGVYNEFSDPVGFQFQAREARQMGFDGKTLIHPSQVEPANRAFSPSPQEVDWARMVVAAFDDSAQAGRGAIAIGGRMVERLHLGPARAILAASGDRS
ncbi:MAG: CoA ester lyase [Pseudomonadota bacterium]